MLHVGLDDHLDVPLDEVMGRALAPRASDAHATLAVDVVHELGRHGGTPRALLLPRPKRASRARTREHSRARAGTRDDHEREYRERHNREGAPRRRIRTLDARARVGRAASLRPRKRLVVIYSPTLAGGLITRASSCIRTISPFVDSERIREAIHALRPDTSGIRQADNGRYHAAMKNHVNELVFPMRTGMDSNHGEDGKTSRRRRLRRQPLSRRSRRVAEERVFSSLARSRPPPALRADLPSPPLTSARPCVL